MKLLVATETHKLFRVDDKPYNYIVYARSNGFLHEVWRGWYFNVKSISVYFSPEEVKKAYGRK